MSGSGIRQGPSGVPIGNGTIPGQIVYWDEDSRNWAITPAGPGDNQSPVWNASSNRWDFSAAPSLSDLDYLGLEHDPVALYAFNQTLEDLSGNGHDLQLSAGNGGFADIVPGKSALAIWEGARYMTAAAAPLLAIDGDLTIEMICQQDGTPPTNPHTVCTYNGNGETEGENTLYQFNFEQTGAYTNTRNLASIWEFGSGSNVNYSSGGTGQSLSPIHNIVFLAMRRRANRVQFFANGRTLGAESSVLTAPTGGNAATCRFVVGANSPGSTNAIVLILMSLKILDVALTDSEIVEEYNRTVGKAFGPLAA